MSHDFTVIKVVLSTSADDKNLKLLAMYKSLRVASCSNSIMALQEMVEFLQEAWTDEGLYS